MAVFSFNDVKFLGNGLFEISGESFVYIMSVAMVCDWACLNKTVSDYNKPGDWWKVAVGLFGEASFGSIHGIFPDFSKKGKGDGGIDFRINGVTYDVKCTETKKEVLLVRVVNEDGEYVPLSADQYVGTKMVSFDEDARIAVVQIMGTASRKWLEALPETPGLPKNAKWFNKEVSLYSLYPIYYNDKLFSYPSKGLF